MPLCKLNHCFCLHVCNLWYSFWKYMIYEGAEVMAVTNPIGFSLALLSYHRLVRPMDKRFVVLASRHLHKH